MKTERQTGRNKKKKRKGMLQKVMRHGFEFWVAPRNRGPVFEEVDPEYQMQRERMRLRLRRAELLAQIIALVSFDRSEPQNSQSVTDLNAKTAKSARGGYATKKENPND